jgi:ribosomal protein S13
MKLKKPVSISNSIIHLMDFVKAKLISDLSDEEEESPKNSQPNSEASEEFTPTTHVIKVNFYLKTKKDVMEMYFIKNVLGLRFTLGLVVWWGNPPPKKTLGKSNTEPDPADMKEKKPAEEQIITNLLEQQSTSVTILEEAKRWYHARVFLISRSSLDWTLEEPTNNEALDTVSESLNSEADEI